MKIIDTSELNKLLSVYKKVYLVTSEQIFNKLKWYIKCLTVNDSIKIIFVPDGEVAKSWHSLQSVLEDFESNRIDKDSILIAFGGGTVGDLIGFAAGIYLRGIKYIQIPTTLLSMVDSAHGGKNGINFMNHKNQLGLVNEPIAVVIEKSFLKSLKKNHIIDGLGEVIKVGYLKDVSILNDLWNCRNIYKDFGLLSKLVDKAIKVKYFFIKQDYKDEGVRNLLNLGHTIAHAIELDNRIPHGLAVIIGMHHEFALSEKLGFSKAGIREKYDKLIKHLGMSIDFNAYAFNKEHILHDKKIRSNMILFPYVKFPGSSSVKRIKIDYFLNEMP